MPQEITELKGGWQVELDASDPCGSFVLGRADGRFFRVVFNSQSYGQPILEEITGEDGIAGSVIPIVKSIDGVWNVLVTENLRPANNYEEPLVEGARTSATNDNPFLSSDGEEIEMFAGYVYSNSARIVGKIQVGVCDVTDSDQFELPDKASFLTFQEFFDQSTDALTKAALGHFMVSVLGCAS